jgi:hypothetical protein
MGPPLWSSAQESLATDPEVQGSIPCATRGASMLTSLHPLSAKVGTNIADLWRSLGRYSLLAD